MEHPRIFHFRHGGADLVYVSSADWMPRNLFRRIEQMFPVESPDLKARVLDEVLAIGFADSARGWRLQADGQYVPIVPEDGTPVRSQERFIERARKAGLKSIPYERSLRESRASRKRKKKKKNK